MNERICEFCGETNETVNLCFLNNLYFKVCVECEEFLNYDENSPIEECFIFSITKELT